MIVTSESEVLGIVLVALSLDIDVEYARQVLCDLSLGLGNGLIYSSMRHGSSLHVTLKVTA